MPGWTSSWTAACPTTRTIGTGPGARATTGLSDALAVGEVSARRVWDRSQPALLHGEQGADHFLSELAWREFARDLMHTFPAMATTCWRPEWSRFPWRNDNAQARAWRRGQTGVAIVDAGMREMFATGQMHNRVLMITASFLTKHLLTDWRVGLDWFARSLTDWDPASNAMNWQWVAGCGPDASPFFRIFNPDTQADKFDGRRAYRDHWLQADTPGTRAFADAVPLSWQFDSARAVTPVIALAEGRERALTAYAQSRSGGAP